jgi:hypothetical protein
MNLEEAENQLHSSHYVKMVTALGDTHPVYTTKDIYSSTGLKLCNAGVRLNSSLNQLLLLHKLVPRLDECVTMEGQVTPQALKDEAVMMVGFEPNLQKMYASMVGGNDLFSILEKIPISNLVGLKLSVMRDQRAHFFKRSLYATLVAIYSGMHLGLSNEDLIDLATSALLHDIGLLHIDPSLLESDHKMTEMERRHLYAHPITAWLILKSLPEYPAKVAEAVLQHHEYLDGSGYPCGLSSPDIGLFAQIIGLSEIVASCYGKENDPYDSARLETILKLNAKRYGPQLIGHFKIFFAEPTDLELRQDENHNINRKLAGIAEVLNAWDALQPKLERRPFFNFMDQRVRSLKLEALDAGFNPHAPSNPFEQTDDHSAEAYLNVLLDEIIWQLSSILSEARRRLGNGIHEESVATAALDEWMALVERQIDEIHQTALPTA